MKFSAEEFAEDVRRRQTFSCILFGNRLAFVVSREASQDADDGFQLPVAQLIQHGVRRLLEFLPIHALIVADTHVRVENARAFAQAEQAQEGA
jgi:hypothetical protein